eukprot:TRINITY_DN4555_c0_g4_i3.p1 TRINITY_DN4555_c0_g4~~TRINITY_DN4555_c0_g4_i3.p1  ORF type:complete len:493 (+),score=91.07 TRINITY_DN4555_c0_g4_i3:26-1504(+)
MSYKIVILCCLVVLVTGNYTLHGEGVTQVTLSLSKLIYGYQQTDPSYTMEYHPILQSNALSHLKDGNIDYAFAQFRNQFVADPKVISFPWFGQAYAFCYNLPELYDTPLYVNMSRAILLNIINATIRRWDHPQLLELNPALAAIPLQNPNIELYMRGGNSDAMAVFNDYMTSMSRPYNYPNKNLDYIPPEYADQYNITLTAGDYLSLFYPLSKVNGSFSFAPISLISLYGLSNIRCASILSLSYSMLRQPTVNSVQNQLQVAVYNTSTGLVTLPATPPGWPIVSISYLYLNVANSTPDDPQFCASRRSLLKFFRWTLLSPNAYQPLYSEGYVVIFGTLRDQVLQQMDLLTCDGNFSLQYETEFNLLQKTKIGLIATSTLFLVVIILVGFFMIYKYETHLIGRFYNLIIIFASILSYVGLLLYSIPPDKAMICQSRVWLTFLSVAIFIGAIFVRNIQMKAIQDIVDKGKFKKKINNGLIMLLGMSIIVGIELV